MFLSACVCLLAKLTAQIVVGPDYPDVAPIFCVSVTWGTTRHSHNDVHIQVGSFVQKLMKLYCLIAKFQSSKFYCG